MTDNDAQTPLNEALATLRIQQVADDGMTKRGPTIEPIK